MLNAIAVVATAVARTSRQAVAVLAAGVLAACAHGGTKMSVSTGEVARTLVAPSELGGGRATAAPQPSDAFRPIALAELASAIEPRGRSVARSVAATAPRPAELWQGTYEGKTYGQRGALALVLRPADDGTLRGVVAWRAASNAAHARPGSTDPVALVRVAVVSSSQEAGQVVLGLDSYFDPACNCTAHATFRGTLRGDTLTGRFVVEGAATVVSEERGRWRAVRVARSPNPE
jgi:hypothetical protein